MRMLLIIIMAMVLCGCTCFRVCQPVPPPPENVARPKICYPLLREDDPISKILECYVSDIVSLEGYGKQLEKLLEPYQK